MHTGLPDQQEEPHAAGEVDEQRDGVARVPQEVQHGEEGAVDPALEPARPDVRPVERRVGGRVVVAGRAPDEGCREAPGHADQEEAQDVVEGGRLRPVGGG